MTERAAARAAEPNWPIKAEDWQNKTRQAASQIRRYFLSRGEWGWGLFSRTCREHSDPTEEPQH
jgi:hypothetical protein